MRWQGAVGAALIHGCGTAGGKDADPYDAPDGAARRRGGAGNDGTGPGSPARRQRCDGRRNSA